MRKLNRGFTLIELLVVVAIIGILASVGVVAYNGYTASAKKGVAKSNHANAVKFITAEIAKCGVESEVFVYPAGGEGTDAYAAGSMTCDATGYATLPAPAINSLNGGEFNNPFTNNPGAVEESAAAVTGDVQISYADPTVTIKTCLTDTCTGDEVLESTAVHD